MPKVKQKEYHVIEQSIRISDYKVTQPMAPDLPLSSQFDLHHYCKCDTAKCLMVTFHIFKCDTAKVLF